MSYPKIKIRQLYINRYFLIASILWMMMIFALSSRPAEVSSNDSLFIANLLESIIPDAIDTELFASNLGFECFNGFVRKLAHFSIYAILGILLYLSVNTSNISQKLVLLPWVISSFYAITDEIHQYFVPGRACLLSDIILDSLGALFGILVIHTLFKLFIKSKS